MLTLQIDDIQLREVDGDEEFSFTIMINGEYFEIDSIDVPIVIEVPEGN